MRTILIVDDDPLNRLHLEHFLRGNKWHALAASDGREGVEKFRQYRPDMVLMDVMMPVMDGYEATSLIKAEISKTSRDTGEDWVPIIFLTGLNDKKQLAECLFCGGDDFISKPFEMPILKARIQAWMRKVALSERLAHDREAVENVLLKIRQDNSFDSRRIRVLMTPVDRTAGDLVYSACRNDQIQHIMVGNVAGHGLSAAICGPMVSDIFYNMTGRDLPAQEILVEINRKIYQKLPANIFMATSFLEMDWSNQQLTLWNFSMPDLLIFHHGKLSQRVSSKHISLGIRETLADLHHGVTIQTHPSDLVYACSDGFVASRSMGGTLFETEVFKAALEEIIHSDKPLESIYDLLSEYRGTPNQVDGITLMELQC